MIVPNLIQLWVAIWNIWKSEILESEREGVIDEVVKQGKVWRVKHHATLWFAQSSKAVSLHPGDWVKVVDRKGLLLFVEPLEKSEP